MGVEYERWLIARGNVFCPGGAAITKFVEKLRAEKWIIDPASPELARLSFRGPRAQHGQATGGYAIKAVKDTFGKDRDALLAKIAASTEGVPAALDAEWIDDPSRADLKIVWTVSCEGDLSLRYPL